MRCLHSKESWHAVCGFANCLAEALSLCPPRELQVFVAVCFFVCLFVFGKAVQEHSVVHIGDSLNYLQRWVFLDSAKLMASGIKPQLKTKVTLSQFGMLPRSLPCFLFNEVTSAFYIPIFILQKKSFSKLNKQ